MILPLVVIWKIFDSKSQKLFPPSWRSLSRHLCTNNLRNSKSFFAVLGFWYFMRVSLYMLNCFAWLSRFKESVSVTLSSKIRSSRNCLIFLMHIGADQLLLFDDVVFRPRTSADVDFFHLMIEDESYRVGVEWTSCSKLGC